MFAKTTIYIILSFTSFCSYAQCPKPVQYLEKEEKANCSGYLFSPEKELELRIKNENYKLLMEQTKLYIEQIELYKRELETTDKIVNKEREKADLWRTAAEKATEKYVTLEESRTVRDWVFLVSGIGLTVLAGWSLGQIN